MKRLVYSTWNFQLKNDEPTHTYIHIRIKMRSSILESLIRHRQSILRFSDHPSDRPVDRTSGKRSSENDGKRVKPVWKWKMNRIDHDFQKPTKHLARIAYLTYHLTHVHLNIDNPPSHNHHRRHNQHHQSVEHFNVIKSLEFHCVLCTVCSIH